MTKKEEHKIRLLLRDFYKSLKEAFITADGYVNREQEIVKLQRLIFDEGGKFNPKKQTTKVL